jgi:hypothetical protein
MALPELSQDERVLLDAYTSANYSQSNTFMWGYILCGVIISVVAVFYNAAFLTLCGMLVILGCRLYEEQSQRPWLPVLQSLLRKLEQAAVAGEPRAGDGAQSQSNVPQKEHNKASQYQLSVRDLFWLLFVAGLCAGWWIDHSHLLQVHEAERATFLRIIEFLRQSDSSNQ